MSSDLLGKLLECCEGPRRKVKRSQHPTLPLAIFNYTGSVQSRKEWDDVTLQARGLVLDTETGTVVARPMEKFFNWKDGKHKASDSDPFTVLDKVDGSLGIYFCYKGQWIMASRGSFISEQARHGQMLADRAGLVETCNAEYTYMFEIIYPSNRVVIDYGEKEELVLLGCVNTATGEDVANDVLPKVACQISPSGQVKLPLSYPEHQGQDLHELAALQSTGMGREGFVVRFSTTGERVKIKFADYLELHRLKSKFSLSKVKD